MAAPANVRASSWTPVNSTRRSADGRRDAPRQLFQQRAFLGGLPVRCRGGRARFTSASTWRCSRSRCSGDRRDPGVAHFIAETARAVGEGEAAAHQRAFAGNRARMVGAGAALACLGLGALRGELRRLCCRALGGFQRRAGARDRTGQVRDDALELSLGEFLAGQLLPEEAVAEADGPHREQQVEDEGNAPDPPTRFAGDDMMKRHHHRAHNEKRRRAGDREFDSAKFACIRVGGAQVRKAQPCRQQPTAGKIPAAQIRKARGG